VSPASIGVAAVVVLLTPGAGQAPSRWLGVFAPLPGARELCSQHVLGGSTARTRIEIAFTLYATTKPTPDVIRFYAAAQKQAVATDATTLVVKADRGHKVLSVLRAGDDRPSCGIDPRPDEPTVVLVSEETPG
jgi:hypothetical protein